MSRGNWLRSLNVGLRDMGFLLQAVGAMEGRLAGEGPRAGRFWGWGGDQRQDGCKEGAVRRGEDEVMAKAVSMEHRGHHPGRPCPRDGHGSTSAHHRCPVWSEFLTSQEPWEIGIYG